MKQQTYRTGHCRYIIISDNIIISFSCVFQSQRMGLNLFEQVFYFQYENRYRVINVCLNSYVSHLYVRTCNIILIPRQKTEMCRVFRFHNYYTVFFMTFNYHKLRIKKYYGTVRQYGTILFHFFNQKFTGDCNFPFAFRLKIVDKTLNKQFIIVDLTEQNHAVMFFFCFRPYSTYYFDNVQSCGVIFVNNYSHNFNLYFQISSCQMIEQHSGIFDYSILQHYSTCDLF